ncbi:class I SAM-dependent methyltransferase [Usitatibacter palustris]|uniref:2-methoxy-6-polyprenyl-1,4-benzoquinol methylase, mitochondrial n=1 Tax=Usitatibacter palustris TaxID=2732487 RepID=A0A6M4HBN9_9PROT|nr:class I SAM-dependent methyltransferase [Usitatibacter palustris]QJR16515.1 2-methoxy-6-polyprenyl-1,4-benzoquinol methylase, mitochondrial [Usitatibacter palustris]
MRDSEFVQDATYADHFGAYKSILNRVLDHDPAMFELPVGIRIVDIGCGYGDLLKLLRSRGHTNLMGVEPDLTCLEGARKEGFEVREGTLTATGLPDACTDAVIVSMVFHHVDDYDAAIREVARVLKPGGLLCVMEPAPTVLRTLMDFLTFKTPLPRISKSVGQRYAVMKLEIETGLYPKFLAEQKSFHAILQGRFEKVWLRRAWFFQFGKYRLRSPV